MQKCLILPVMITRVPLLPQMSRLKAKHKRMQLLRTARRRMAVARPKVMENPPSRALFSMRTPRALSAFFNCLISGVLMR